MKLFSFSFFTASSSEPISTTPNNNELFPSTVVAPTLPSVSRPNVTTPVFVFPKIS
ncbi:hypothetical protein NOS3756_47180 [Nostoc sp. NIES-3756]|uniref:hypothetical protein n=1 Tax=Nostoc sp. NIES-3756 TaxID=1751286 RepID=UPI0007213889|nr:hypothetical protein [Nostoc sp. NIES-3756]BAT55725.1 hypothetical protein NOS3756_47180 [Nostoc sp. NIES-3756]BAY36515.1 hypothetical protein NIES2111_08420 [Nostoc sp. NIES-2111]